MGHVKASPFAQYVHHYSTFFYVAEEVEPRCFQWPLPQFVIKNGGGVHTGQDKHPAYSPWRYRTRAGAMAAARRLYKARHES